MNLTPGGLLGYASSKCITRRNVPSSKGVSAGPIITAFLHSARVSFHFSRQSGLQVGVLLAGAKLPPVDRVTGESKHTKS